MCYVLIIDQCFILLTSTTKRENYNDMVTFFAFLPFKLLEGPKYVNEGSMLTRVARASQRKQPDKNFLFVHEWTVDQNVLHRCTIFCHLACLFGWLHQLAGTCSVIHQLHEISIICGAPISPLCKFELQPAPLRSRVVEWRDSEQALKQPGLAHAKSASIAIA